MKNLHLILFLILIFLCLPESLFSAKKITNMTPVLYLLLSNRDCNADKYGTAYIDNCGICVGGNTGLSPCLQDCNGDWGGTAYLDNCSICVSGETGLLPCLPDCNGDFLGTAYIDPCGTCVGGETGLTECPDPGGTPVSIKIYPEHVGVFTSIGLQQFIVIGIRSNGYPANVTSQTTCTSSDPSKVVIDSNGLATIQSTITSGQVKITCTYTGLPSDSTSLTVVNVEEKYYGGNLTTVDVTLWPGAWPSTSGASFYPNGQELYLYDAVISGHGQIWSTRPWETPYPPFPEAGGLNSMIVNVFSVDGGETFRLYSWDYLSPTSHSKGGEGTWDDCWIGTMVHSFCDFQTDYCNGRFRSNLYFSSYNSDPTCWGLQVIK